MGWLRQNSRLRQVQVQRMTTLTRMRKARPQRRRDSPAGDPVSFLYLRAYSHMAYMVHAAQETRFTRKL